MVRKARYQHADNQRLLWNLHHDVLEEQGTQSAPYPCFYGSEAATFYIADGEIYEGAFPNRAKKMVKEFVLKYQKELMEMWDTGVYKKLKGLE